MPRVEGGIYLGVDTIPRAEGGIYQVLDTGSEQCHERRGEYT